MATDIATLGIKVENGDVIKATTSLNSMEVAGSKAEASTQRLTRRMALLEIQAREMNAQMGKSHLSFTHMAEVMGLSETAAGKLIHTLSALGGIAIVGLIGHKVVEETELAQAAMAQLEAAVQATGGAAGRTVEQLDELSKALQRQTTYSDEAVKGAEAILLTFNKIKGDTFDRATVAVADFATRFSKDIPEAALIVGKALQAPVEGLQALQRVGVRFSASQKDTIRDLVDTGHAAEAQGLILAELEGKFKGSAAAARDTLGGALKGLHNAWGDLFEVTKSGTQGTVDGINAITHALESSGLSMSTILKDATVDWETMSASVEKFRAIMALQVDTKFLQNARNIIQRIDDDLTEKIHQLNKPAKTEPAGAPGGATTDELTDTARKFAALVAQRDAEIGKLAALNAAYRESAVTLALLGIQYDAQSKKSENVQGHTVRETAILNARTDALTRQKVAQVLLNDQLDRERKLQTARDQNTGAIEAALHARDRADLAGPDAEIQALRDRATEEIAAARRAHDQKQELRADEQATEDAMLRERIANIHATTDAEVDGIRRARQAATELAVTTTVRDTDAEIAGIRAMAAAELEGGQAAEQMRVQLAGNDAVQRALNDAVARGTELTDAQAGALRRSAEELERTRINAEKLRAVFQEVRDAANQFFTDVFSRKNPFPALAARIKAELVGALSDAVARPLTIKIAKVLGIEVPEDKQIKAAKDMNVAADKQLRAAAMMNGSVTGDGSDVATQRYVSQFTDTTPPWQRSGGTYPIGPHDPRIHDPSLLDRLETKLPAFLQRTVETLRVVAKPAIEGALVGYGVGTGLYSQSHGDLGNYARGALGGAAAGAVAGSAFGPIGTAVGAVAGFIGGIVGVGHAAKEAAKATEELRTALSLTMDSLRAEVGKDALSASIAQVEAQREQIRKQIEDAYSGGGANSDTVRERNRQLAELNALEDERIKQLQQEASVMQTRTLEDFQARRDAAIPGNERQEALAAIYRQLDREREDLIRSFGSEIDAREAAILAMADEAFAAEKQKAATDAATGALDKFATAVRNAPEGFKLEPYIQQFATGRSQLANPLPLPTNPFVPPMTPGGGPRLSRSSSTGTVATAPVTINVGGLAVTVAKTNASADEIAKSVVRKLDEFAASLGGLNSDRVAALKRYPSA